MICNGCDSPATVRLDGAVWCGTHALARLTGIAPPSDGNPSPAAGAVQGTPPSAGFPSTGDGPRPLAQVSGVRPPPLPSWDVLRDIFAAQRQWHDVELDLMRDHGMTLNDLAKRLEAELEATA